MLPPPPTPLYTLALIALLPGIWLLARHFCLRLLSAKDAHACVPAVSLGGWVLAIHLIATWTGAFYVGLCIGTLLPGALGYILAWKRPPAAKRMRPWPRANLIAAAAGVVALAPIALGYDFHDKVEFLAGHLSITEQMLNNVYPPRDLYFPDQPMAYHFGVDTLFAAVAAVFHLPAYLAIDLVTLSCWGYTLLLFGHLAYRLFGCKRSWPAVGIGGFAGGIPWLAMKQFVVLQAMLGLYHFEPFEEAWHLAPLWINPSLVSYFFQHPWTIGLPLVLAAVTIGHGLLEGRKGWPLLAAVLLPVSFCSLPLALTVSAALATQFAWTFIRNKQRNLGTGHLVPALLVALVALGWAFSGPMLEAGAVRPMLKWTTTGMAGRSMDSLIWNLAVFGLLLPVGVLAWRRITSLRLFFALMVAVNILLANTVRFSLSWDMVKFATIAQATLALLAAGYLAKVVRRPVLLGIVSLVVSLQSITFVFAFWIFKDLPYPKQLVSNPVAQAVPEPHRDAMTWLRAHAVPGDMVYAPGELNFPYAILAGLPQLGVDANALAFGHDRLTLEHRQRLNQGLGQNLEAYRAAGVDWIVIDPGHPASMPLDLWAQSAEVEQVAQFGHVRILKLIPLPAHSE